MKKDSGVFSVFVSPRSFPLTIAIIFLLIFGAASVIAYQHYRSTLHHTINENKSTANILSNLIYEHQKAAIRILESYASRPRFVDAIQKKDFAQAIPRLKSLSEHHPEIDAPFLTDQHGTLWANYPVSREGFGKNLAYRDWYKGVSRNRRPYISSAYRLIVLGKGLAVAVSVPVFDKKGKVIGILSSAQRTAFLAALIKANTLDPKKHTTLLDQEGNIICSDTIEYEKEITKYPQFSLIQKTIRDGRNAFDVPDHIKKGREDILAFSSVRDIGWTVIVGEKKGAIFKSERGYFIGTFVIAFLLLVCMTIAFLLLQRELRHKKTKELLEKERQLRESEDNYRSIFENVVEGIFQTTPDGRFLTVNPVLARIYGYSSPEEVIEEITDIARQVYVNPDERDEFLRIIQEKDVVEGFELQMRRKDGSTFWGSINARSVYDERGKLLYYEGTSVDITERKRAQEALRRKVDELERFNSLTVGRELRIIELKKEINGLLKKAGEPEKHRIAE